MSIDSLESLRNQLKEATSGTLGEEMMAFMELASHPDVEWGDLLDGLGRSGVIAEDAALRLHKLLNVHRDGIRVNRDARFWQEILEKAGISRSDKVAPA